ncbi:hypothetical protein C812_02799 [Paenibacillus barengoltzii G22]|uniref:Uncharacterized protein n=1 Tax=Paenibacillus barengoltzii G22 TaxID=1235795 RepID=R9LIU1_9BACL|nr:hypothetical protein C812_02799 [Paenibacillus barengoltzii G22]
MRSSFRVVKCGQVSQAVVKIVRRPVTLLREFLANGWDSIDSFLVVWYYDSLITY